MSASTTHTGKVKFFNKLKGFGFIIQDNGQDLFFHATGVNNNAEPKKDELVSFIISDGKKGQLAKQIEIITNN